MTYTQFVPVRKRLADPLSRNGLALLANTGVTGVLGFGYWIAAARLFPATAVGSASALISAVSLFAALGQLNLSGAVMRFLPVAGWRSRQLVIGAYAFAAGTSALLAAVVLAVFAPAGSPLHVGGPAAAGLVLAAAGTAVFALQDSVLTGLRRGIWIPVENALFGLAKIVLLVVLASRATATAILSSWMVPMLAVIPLVNALLFGRFLPSRRAGTQPHPSLTRGSITRFVAGDAVAGLFSQAWAYLLPVVVAAALGTVANAHFYVAFLLSSTVDLVAANLAAALTVEAAHHPERLPALVRTTLLRSLALVVPLVTVLAVLAPWILRWYGPGYADGVPVLRLLLLASLPRCVLVVYAAVCRAHGRTGRSAALFGVVCAAVIAGTALATGPLGLVGVGLAVLAAHLLVGLAALAWLVPVLR
ncbi:MAG: hypothetical protein V7603_6011 [Micromonosporaceae bacterium]